MSNPQTFTWDNSDYTHVAGEKGPDGASALTSGQGGTRWFKFTPPSGGPFVATTAGSTTATDDPADTWLALYIPGGAGTPASVADLFFVTANDDEDDSTITSRLDTVTLTGGQVYYLQVGGYNASDPVTNMVLELSYTPAGGGGDG